MAAAPVRDISVDQVVRRCLPGVATWAVWALAVRPGWPATALLFSPLVMAPVAWFLALGWDLPNLDLRARERTHLLAWVRFIAACAAALSFMPGEGVFACVLTVPWLLVGCTSAVTGATRLASRRHLTPLIATDVAVVFVAVGCAWLSISRAGANPLGFSDTIVLLTAVHFHYAGLVLPMVSGFVAAQTPAPFNVPSWVVPGLVVAGIPLTAVGITAGGTTEWLSATFMAMAGVATAFLLVGYARTVATGWARWVAAAAGALLMLGMALALGWAWSVRFGWRFLDVDTMARTHGSINAFGFGLLALAALVKATCESGQPAVFQPAVHLFRRPDQPHLTNLVRVASTAEPTSPTGLLSRASNPGYHRDVWTVEVRHGFDAARSAVQQWASHRSAGITVTPHDAPLTVGQTVSISIPLGVASITATCRIIETVDEPDRFGFAYATLPHHPEDGEESFIVERQPDGTVTYTITAVWRAGMLCTRIAPWVTRRVQQRTTRRYLDGVVNHIGRTPPG